ncbi:SDR family oxidoreductase [Dactylosporangium sp. AC04546]|uniref:SDR family oxidoreductase n=1 Tax=Dactylosporangium sp. AC04546 TaxID=2862460 RepID=UPI001EDDE234|nr:SDR family oxidoreductase [Dactylosporangium sp. AC04546]WVK81081.1 SDR family oxidoreductase [Dactylosporangium sp. AC04546]
MRLLVTGAAGGIGAAVVRLAIEAGHDVLGHDLGWHEHPDGAETVAGDLTDPAHLAALAERAESFGLDAVVASHGIQGAGALRDLDAARVRAILLVNAGTVPRLFAATRPALARRQGRFVVTTSQAALRAEPDNSAYCAAKWAAQAWVAAQAMIEGPTGVAVRALCPGRTETPLLVRATEEVAAAQGISVEAYTASVVEHIPLRRYATTRETAAAALFLAEPGIRPAVLANTGGEVPW